MKSRNNLEKYHLHKEKPFQRQFEVYDLSEYWTKNQIHSVKPHSHSYYQIIWFFDGGGKHYVDFESHSIGNDTMFFISKDQIHNFEMQEGYRGILIHFNEIFLYQTEEDIDIFIQYNVFNSMHSPSIQVNESINRELKSFINIMQSELDNRQRFGHNAILSNILKAFLITVEREKRAVLDDGEKKGHSLRLVKFRKLLEVGYRQNWSVSKYAQELNVSVKTLNNILKSNTGETTSQLINNRIILEAKRQLFHSNAFVNEIGYDLGFQDPSYFVKYFKKHVNLTPSEFRNQNS